MSHVAGINSLVQRPAVLLSLASRSRHLILSTSAFIHMDAGHLGG